MCAHLSTWLVLLPFWPVQLLADPATPLSLHRQLHVHAPLLKLSTARVGSGHSHSACLWLSAQLALPFLLLDAHSTLNSLLGAGTSSCIGTRRAAPHSLHTGQCCVWVPQSFSNSTLSSSWAAPFMRVDRAVLWACHHGILSAPYSF